MSLVDLFDILWLHVTCVTSRQYVTGAIVKACPVQLVS